MRLLIITQAVDLDNPILGFFHGWIKEFSKYAEHIDIICLESGRSDLPKNARVYSLGKEKSVSRLGYVLNFYTYLWRLRKDYDTVFIHMNQEYVLLGGILWRMLGKQVLFWRNHKRGNFLTRISVWLSHKVFCTTPESYTAGFKKTSLMPVGIDTDVFRRKPDIQKAPRSILFLGRISPVKRADRFIEALFEMKEHRQPFRALVVGDPPPPDQKYDSDIKRLAAGIGDEVSFCKSVRNEDTVDLYNACELYVNLTPSGSLDKTIFEAMSCETLVFVSNQALRGSIDGRLVFGEGTERISSHLDALLSLPEEEKKSLALSLRAFVVQTHSLEKLARSLFEHAG